MFVLYRDGLIWYVRCAQKPWFKLRTFCIRITLSVAKYLSSLTKSSNCSASLGVQTLNGIVSSSTFLHNVPTSPLLGLRPWYPQSCGPPRRTHARRAIQSCMTCTNSGMSGNATHLTGPVSNQSIHAMHSTIGGQDGAHPPWLPPQPMTSLPFESSSSEELASKMVCMACWSFILGVLVVSFLALSFECHRERSSGL